MAYIGIKPAEEYTSFATQTFSTSATTSYTLDHPVTNENELALFINNVRQQPGSGNAYTASGTALSLSAATASTDTMYAIFLGRALQTVNPPAASVGASQVADTLISGKTALGSAPADTDEFLVSDAGTLKRIDYSLIKSTPTHTLISTSTVSSAASEIVVSSGIDTTYKAYMIEIINIHPATDNQSLRMQMRQSGSTISSSVYDYAFHQINSSGTNTFNNEENAAYINICNNVNNESEGAICARIMMYDPAQDGTHDTKIMWNSAYEGGSGGDNMGNTHGSGRIESTTAVDGFRLYMGSGNIDTCTAVKLYGVS